MFVLRSWMTAVGVIVGVSIAGTASFGRSHGESEFIDRFKGQWSGTGWIHSANQSQPRQVDCSVVGTPGDNRLAVQGTCSAAFGAREIGAELDFDPASRTYRGVYTGSRIGPARLTGTRSGDVVKLRVQWPQPLNGDTQASLVIQNDGNGGLRITVADNLYPGGPEQQTSQLVLQRR